MSYYSDIDTTRMQVRIFNDFDEKDRETGLFLLS